MFSQTFIQFTGFEVILFVVPLIYKDKWSKAKWATSDRGWITSLIYSLTLFVVIGSMTVGETKSLTWPTVSLIQALELKGSSLNDLIFFADDLDVPTVYLYAWLFPICH
ncbi:GerAB/ArcD/ProY family transporter [Bacillus sp. SL00103]